MTNSPIYCFLVIVQALRLTRLATGGCLLRWHWTWTIAVAAATTAGKIKNQREEKVKKKYVYIINGESFIL